MACDPWCWQSPFLLCLAWGGVHSYISSWQHTIKPDTGLWISNCVVVNALLMCRLTVVCNIIWMPAHDRYVAISVNFRFVRGRIAVNNGNSKLHCWFPLVLGDLCVLTKGLCSRLESSIYELQKPVSVSLWIKFNFFQYRCVLQVLQWFLSNCVDLNVYNVGGFGIYFGVNLSITNLWQGPGLPE